MTVQYDLGHGGLRLICNCLGYKFYKIKMFACFAPPSKSSRMILVIYDQLSHNTEPSGMLACVFTMRILVALQKHGKSILETCWFDLIIAYEWDSPISSDQILTCTFHICVKRDFSQYWHLQVKMVDKIINKGLLYKYWFSFYSKANATM